jgi:phospholipase/lecithinase/hemolysin
LANDDKASPDSLFVVWIGANNYLGLPEEVEKSIQDVNTGITHGLQRLVDKGAKHILVLNLPDLGRTPAAIEFNSVTELSYFAMRHNAALDASMAELKQTHPEVNWLYFDLNKSFAHVLDYPSEYGFTNTTGTCFNATVDEVTKKSVLRMVASVKPNTNQKGCEGYLFFDLVHPTGVAHKIMADKARIMLDAEGLEFSE